jgi:hypothetical protein
VIIQNILAQTPSMFIGCEITGNWCYLTINHRKNVYKCNILQWKVWPELNSLRTQLVGGFPEDCDEHLSLFYL